MIKVKSLKKYISITSIPGAGPILAITTICYLPELGTIKHKEISSLSGGPHLLIEIVVLVKGKGVFRVVEHKLEKFFTYVHLTAREWNSYIKTFFDRLHDQYKKPYKVASTAAMRKLLILANSLVRDGRIFTKEYSPQSA